MHLEYTQEIDDWDVTIPPNFILILIENCFKHGVLMNRECDIIINLEIKDRKLILKN